MPFTLGYRATGRASVSILYTDVVDIHPRSLAERTLSSIPIILDVFIHVTLAHTKDGDVVLVVVAHTASCPEELAKMIAALSQIRGEIRPRRDVSETSTSGVKQIGG